MAKLALGYWAQLKVPPNHIPGDWVKTVIMGASGAAAHRPPQYEYSAVYKCKGGEVLTLYYPTIPGCIIKCDRGWMPFRDLWQAAEATGFEFSGMLTRESMQAFAEHMASYANAA